MTSQSWLSYWGHPTTRRSQRGLVLHHPLQRLETPLSPHLGLSGPPGGQLSSLQHPALGTKVPALEGTHNLRALKPSLVSVMASAVEGRRETVVGRAGAQSRVCGVTPGAWVLMQTVWVGWRAWWSEANPEVEFGHGGWRTLSPTPLHPTGWYAAGRGGASATGCKGSVPNPKAPIPVAEGGETAEEDGGLTLQHAELLGLPMDTGDGQEARENPECSAVLGGGDDLRWLQVRCGVCACLLRPSSTQGWNQPGATCWD